MIYWKQHFQNWVFCREELNVANQLKTKIGQERPEEKALVLKEVSEEAKEQEGPGLWTKGQMTSEVDKIKTKHKFMLSGRKK